MPLVIQEEDLTVTLWPQLQVPCGPLSSHTSIPFLTPTAYRTPSICSLLGEEKKEVEKVNTVKVTTLVLFILNPFLHGDAPCGHCEK